MKLPRVTCPVCRRPIAAGPVAGRLTKGRVWRHDDTGLPRIPGEPLVSCSGSLALVDLSRLGHQMEIDLEGPHQADDDRDDDGEGDGGPAPARQVEAPALF